MSTVPELRMEPKRWCIYFCPLPSSCSLFWTLLPFKSISTSMSWRQRQPSVIRINSPIYLVILFHQFTPRLTVTMNMTSIKSTKGETTNLCMWALNMNASFNIPVLLQTRSNKRRMLITIRKKTPIWSENIDQRKIRCVDIDSNVKL